MDIRARILARPDLNELRTARDLDGLAAALNAEGLMAPQQRFITARGILAIDAAEGRAILSSLRAAAALDIGVEFVVMFLGQGEGVDIGDPSTWRDIDGLVAKQILTSAQSFMLKHLSEQPVVVTRLQVEAAMYNPDGTEK